MFRPIDDSLDWESCACIGDCGSIFYFKLNCWSRDLSQLLFVCVCVFGFCHAFSIKFQFSAVQFASTELIRKLCDINLMIRCHNSRIIILIGLTMWLNTCGNFLNKENLHIKVIHTPICSMQLCYTLEIYENSANLIWCAVFFLSFRRSHTHTHSHQMVWRSTFIIYDSDDDLFAYFIRGK